MSTDTNTGCATKCATKCGGFTDVKEPSDESRNVLTNAFELVTAHENLKDLELENALKNHHFSTQVVAGLNYKFNLLYGGHVHYVKVWAKLDKSYAVTYEGSNPHCDTATCSTSACPVVDTVDESCTATCSTSTCPVTETVDESCTATCSTSTCPVTETVDESCTVTQVTTESNKTDSECECNPCVCDPCECTSTHA
jgi:hypothetical protein